MPLGYDQNCFSTGNHFYSDNLITDVNEVYFTRDQRFNGGNKKAKNSY